MPIKLYKKRIIIKILCLQPGLDQALAIFRRVSRRNVGARPVVVFITGGDWNTGGNPLYTVNQLKAENVRL